MSTAVLQRSTDRSFSPIFLSNCNLWLDAADTTTLTLSGANVTQWRDKSGLSNHGTTNGGTTTVSSLNSVQCLSFNATSYFQGSISNTGSSLTSFMVATMNSGTNASGRLLSCGLPTESDNAGASSVTLLNRLTTGTNVYSTRLSVNTTIFAISYATPFLIATQYTGSQNAIYWNGTQQGNSANVAGTFGYQRYRVGDTAGSGSTAKWNGLVGEIIIYNRSLTTQQRQYVEGYLAWKWGLVSNLPTTHPYKLNAPSFVPPIPSAIISYPLPTMKQTALYFNPLSIPGCTFWLDAGDTSSLTISNNLVSQALDKSGTGNTLTQANSAYCPTYALDPVYNKRGLLFNRTNGTVLTPADTSKYMVNGTFWNAFMVFRLDGTSSSVQTITRSPVSGRWVRWGPNALSFYVLNSDIQFSKTNTGGGVFSQIVATNSQVILENGSSAGSGGRGAAPLVQEYYNFGGTAANSECLGGYIFEYIIYSGVTLTTLERQQVEGYLAWKWGLQSSLPVTHPFKSSAPTPIPQLILPAPIKPAKWQPTQVSNCILWLDGKDVTKVGVSGTNVTAWNDKSGLNNNLTTISSIPPTYSSATGAITFSATNQTSIRGALNTTYTNPMSTFIVCAVRLDVNAIYNPRLITFGTNGTTATYFAGQFVVVPFSSSGSTPAFCTYANNNQDPTGQGINLQTYIPTSFLRVGIFENISNYAGTTLTLNTFLDGSTSANSSRTTSWTVAAPYVTNMAYVSLGANTNGSTYLGDDFSGDIYEVLAFSRNVSTVERQQIEGYLAWKWKLVANLPSTHPYKLFPPSS